MMRSKASDERDFLSSGRWRYWRMLRDRRCVLLSNSYSITLITVYLSIHLFILLNIQYFCECVKIWVWCFFYRFYANYINLQIIDLTSAMSSFCYVVYDLFYFRFVNKMYCLWCTNMPIRRPPLLTMIKERWTFSPYLYMNPHYKK